MITYWQVSQTIIYLFSIYDKPEKEIISDKEINELLKHFPE